MIMGDNNGNRPEGRDMNCLLQQTIDYAAIGRHMRLIRKKLGMTQAQMAELLGMSANYYGQYETGKQRINLTRLIQFICTTHSSADLILAGCHADYPSPHQMPENSSEPRRRLNSLLDKCTDPVIESLIIITETMTNRL